MKCHLCEKGDLVSEVVPRVTKIGPYAVKDTVTRERCPACGETFLSGTELHAAELRAAKRVLLEGPAAGAVAKEVRKILGLTQRELSPLIGLSWEAISRLENARTTSPANTMALLLLVERAMRGEPLEGERSEAMTLSRVSA